MMFLETLEQLAMCLKLFLKYQQLRLVQFYTREVDKDRRFAVKVAGFLPPICFSRANKTLDLFSLHAKRYLFTVKL